MTLRPTLKGIAEKREALREVKIQDFWDRVKTPDGCRLYYGAKEANGYGYVKNPLGDDPKYLTAHRLAWILTHGPVPPGMQVLHKCDVRACCNPEHLFLGSIIDNMRDMNRKGRNGTEGERNVHAKINEDQAREILSLKPSGPAPRGYTRQLAEKFGVRQGAINAIWRGDSWAHIAASQQASISNRVAKG